MIYRIAGVFIAIFALIQFSHAEKAQAAVSVDGKTGLSKFETPVHGSGCGCARCMPPSEKIDLPA